MSDEYVDTRTPAHIRNCHFMGYPLMLSGAPDHVHERFATWYSNHVAELTSFDNADCPRCHVDGVVPLNGMSHEEWQRIVSAQIDGTIRAKARIGAEIARAKDEAHRARRWWWPW
jgi:hypothetical protein